MPHVTLEPLRGSAFAVAADGEVIGKTSSEVIKLYPEVYTGEFSDDALAMFMLASSLYAAVMAALKCLSGRSCSSARLSEIIAAKSGASKSLAEQVAAMFEIRGYINDYELARNTALARIYRKPVGPRDIQRHLMQKLFTRQIIERVRTEIFEEFDETELACKALIQKYGRDAGENNPALSAKFSLFLSQRGFGFSSAAAACRRYRSMQDNADSE